MPNLLHPIPLALAFAPAAGLALVAGLPWCHHQLQLTALALCKGRSKAGGVLRQRPRLRVKRCPLAMEEHYAGPLFAIGMGQKAPVTVPWPQRAKKNSEVAVFRGVT